jgi:hypothetical protein
MEPKVSRDPIVFLWEGKPAAAATKVAKDAIAIAAPRKSTFKTWALCGTAVSYHVPARQVA